MARQEMTARPLYQQIARAIASAESARPDYIVHVTPSLASGFALQSRDSSITEHLCDVLTQALARMIEYGEAES